jgi:hypothetical protein
MRGSGVRRETQCRDTQQRKQASLKGGLATGNAPTHAPNSCRARSRLASLDAATGAVRWVTEAGSTDGCFCGLAVVPSQHVVVASAPRSNRLFVHLLEDGTRVGELRASTPQAVACDERSTAIPVIYASVEPAPVLGGCVAAYTCDPLLEPVQGGAGGPAVKRTFSRHALVVIPRGRYPCLVVAELGSSTLQIFSLAGRALERSVDIGRDVQVCLV